MCESYSNQMNLSFQHPITNIYVLINKQAMFTLQTKVAKILFFLLMYDITNMTNLFYLNPTLFICGTKLDTNPTFFKATWVWMSHFIWHFWYWDVKGIVIQLLIISIPKSCSLNLGALLIMRTNHVSAASCQIIHSNLTTNVGVGSDPY